MNVEVSNPEKKTNVRLLNLLIHRTGRLGLLLPVETLLCHNITFSWVGSTVLIIFQSNGVDSVAGIAPAKLNGETEN